MTSPVQAAEIWWPLALLVVAAAAALSAGLIVVLLPALRRHALALPNVRSSHVEPTPQGGGIAVVVATAIVALTAVTLTAPPDERVQLEWVLGAAAFIADREAITAEAHFLAVDEFYNDRRAAFRETIDILRLAESRFRRGLAPFSPASVFIGGSNCHAPQYSVFDVKIQE